MGKRILTEGNNICPRQNDTSPFICISVVLLNHPDIELRKTGGKLDYQDNTLAQVRL
jgi:hypothetical protein